MLFTLLDWIFACVGIVWQLVVNLITSVVDAFLFLNTVTTFAVTLPSFTFGLLGASVIIVIVISVVKIISFNWGSQ